MRMVRMKPPVGLTDVTYGGVFVDPEAGILMVETDAIRFAQHGWIELSADDGFEDPVDVDMGDGDFFTGDDE